MIQNKEFKNRIEVEQHFIEIWDLPLINNEINLAFFYDKKIIIFDRKQKINIISTLNEIFYDGKIFRIKSNEKYNYPLSYVTIEMINPITNKLEKINLSRLISKKFYVSDKVFKSFYYKTKEYQDKINNTSINRNF